MHLLCVLLFGYTIEQRGGGESCSLQLIKMHNSICSHISVSHKTQGSTSSAAQLCRMKIIIKDITGIKLMKKKQNIYN